MRNETCAGCSYYAATQQYHAARHHRLTQATPPDGQFIVEMNPEVEKAVNSALKLCERGEANAAWAQVALLLRDHPGNHMVCFAMGVLHALKNKHEDAIQWFDKAISIYPYFVEAHFNKGVAYQKQLKIAGAVDAYRKVVAFGDPNDTPAKQAQSFLDNMTVAVRKNEGVDFDAYIEAQSIFDDAFTLLEQKDWSGALTRFRASAAKHDRNAPTHGNMGLCFAELGYKAQALAALDRAIAIDPQYAPAINNRFFVENMKEGTPLNPGGFKRVEFGRSKFLETHNGF